MSVVDDTICYIYSFGGKRNPIFVGLLHKLLPFSRFKITKLQIEFSGSYQVKMYIACYYKMVQINI